MEVEKEKRPTRKLSIGVDIDQVVANAFEIVVVQFNKRYGTSFTIEDVQNHYWLEEVSKDSPERVAFLQSLYSHEQVVFTDAVPIPNSQDVLRRLNLAHKIHYVSSRSPHLRRGTMEWLKRFEFPVTEQQLHLRTDPKEDGIAFKVRKVQELGLDVFIEDDERLAQYLSIPVALLDYRWNRDVNANHVFRAHDWHSIEQFIDRVSVS